MKIVIITLLLLVSLGCQADQRPQAIEAHDVCDSCRMAISQLSYAAQIVDREGNSYKFDDIGCMLRFFRERRLAQPRMYVMDFVSRQWLEADKAVFVKSDQIDSPMASGLAAFRDLAAARQFLKGKSGDVTSFSELMSHGSVGAHAADRQH